MDIKGVLNAVLPLQTRGKDKVDRALKSSDTSADRDPNGQAGGQPQQQEQHPPMSDEQFKKSIDHLKSLAVVKDNNLAHKVITL